MATLATLVVKLVADTQEMNDALDKSQGGVKKWASQIGNNIQSIGKIGLAGITAGALALGGAIALLGPQAINAASDFNESLSKVQVVFGDSAGAIEDFSQTASTSLGMSQRDALAAAGTFGNLFRTMGMGEPASAQMSTDLLQLSADLASFNNLDPTEVLDKLRSGLVGETEPLRALGINLTDAAVRAKAVELGLASSTKAVDQAAMTQARFALIMEQSSLAQGDFARTSGGLANQQRILGAMWQDVLQKIGTVALPLLTGALGGFLGLLQSAILPAIDKVVLAFQDFNWMLQSGINPLTAFKIILERFLPPEVAAGIVAAIQAIIAGVQQFITWVAPIATQVAAWIGQNVQLQDVLIAIGAAIARVVVPALVSIIAAAAPIVATFVGLVAAVAAVRAAWESDFLGIRTALTNSWIAMQPALAALVAWFQTNLPVAVQAVSDLWTNTLVPAFEAFVSWAQANLLPLLTSIGNFLTAIGEVTITAIAGAWENILLPALQNAGNWISTNLGPILQNFVTWLGNVTGGVEGISTAIEKVIGWFNQMADKISNVRLPDWMTPGSPTPLELGLLGIADALRQVSRVGLPGLDAGMGGLGTPAPAMATAAVSSAGAAGGAGVGTVNFYIEGATDPEATANAVLRRLQELGLAPATLLR